ncbi:MAG: 4-hydroxy-3-methylbut-2-enyl diphosphate reductase, partial [Parasphingorhabdus sp.]
MIHSDKQKRQIDLLVATPRGFCAGV